MSVVSLLGCKILNNPAGFDDPYKFEITFECLEPLQKDLEWKLVYVGSATSSDHDQELDSLLVGPIPTGVNKFIFEADPPKLNMIPASEILGVTVILLTCSYDGREFVRVGYYVNNEYSDPELQKDPPSKPAVDKVKRNILAEKPRVTRFAIKWDSEDTAPAEFPPDQPDVDNAEDDEKLYGVEEVELEEALIKEEAALKAEEDSEMAGAEETAGAREEDEESEAGSEDLEAESSGSEDEEGGEEEGEEGEGEGDGDEEMDMGDDENAKPAGNKAGTIDQQQGEVMVH